MQFVCWATTPLKDEEFIRHLEHSEKQPMLTVVALILSCAMNAQLCCADARQILLRTRVKY